MSEIVRGAVRFCGLYRSDKYGAVNAAEAALMNSIVRNAYRKNFNGQGVTQGILINLCSQTLKAEDERWQVALERLVNWGFIEIGVAKRADSIVIHITGQGKAYAQELIGNRQINRLPPDGPEEG